MSCAAELEMIDQFLICSSSSNLPKLADMLLCKAVLSYGITERIASLLVHDIAREKPVWANEVPNSNDVTLLSSFVQDIQTKKHLNTFVLGRNRTIAVLYLHWTCGLFRTQVYTDLPRCVVRRQSAFGLIHRFSILVITSHSLGDIIGRFEKQKQVKGRAFQTSQTTRRFTPPQKGRT
jgi:hypothetical protein